MKIGEVAKRANVSVDTVRFYERRGILPPASRRSSGYRIYGEGTVERIHLVKYVQALGIELAEIRSMLSLLDAGTATCENQRPRFEATLARIDREIAALRATRAKIVRLFTACESGKCSLGAAGVATRRVRAGRGRPNARSANGRGRTARPQ
jgi:DNA-binding transcriptional MerR regulator